MSQPTKFSILAGCEVSTYSEEWKHDCEIRYLASLPLGERNALLDGVKDGFRGIRGVRGEAEVVKLRAEIDRLKSLKPQ